jgi:hypothetical protein
MCAECSNCWGSGKTFGDVPTPSQVEVTVYGIEKGSSWLPGDPEPPNGSYTFDQDVLYPCRFNWSDGTWLMHWWAYKTGGSVFTIELIGIEFAFDCTRDQNCRTYFVNEIDDVPASKFCFGAALAFDTWLPDLIAVEYAIAPVPDRTDKFFELTEEELVIRMRTKFGNNRLFVKYDDGI